MKFPQHSRIPIDPKKYAIERPQKEALPIVEQISDALSRYDKFSCPRKKCKESNLDDGPKVFLKPEAPSHPPYLKSMVITRERPSSTVIIQESPRFSFWMFIVSCIIFVVAFFLGYLYFSFKRTPYESFYNKYPSALDDPRNVF